MTKGDFMKELVAFVLLSFLGIELALSKSCPSTTDLTSVSSLRVQLLTPLLDVDSADEVGENLQLYFFQGKYNLNWYISALNLKSIGKGLKLGFALSEGSSDLETFDCLASKRSIQKKYQTSSTSKSLNTIEVSFTKNCPLRFIKIPAGENKTGKTVFVNNVHHSAEFKRTSIAEIQKNLGKRFVVKGECD
jgi:hypothetical protein